MLCFSISLNERFVLEGGFVGLYEWIVKHEDLYFPTWLARDILTENHTYDEALNTLQTRAILAPCSYTKCYCFLSLNSLIALYRNGITKLPKSVVSIIADHKSTVQNHCLSKVSLNRLDKIKIEILKVAGEK